MDEYMRKLVLLVIFAVVAPSYGADVKLKGLFRAEDAPHQNEFWLVSDCKLKESPSLLEERLYSECIGALKTQDYYLRLNFIQDFIRYLVYGTKAGKYILEDGVDTYEEYIPVLLKREDAFKAYASANCQMVNYCGNNCGRGDLDSQAACVSEKVYARVDVFNSEIQQGISLGYVEKMNDKKMYLVTNKFLIEINSSCKSGMFLCEDVTYIGKSKSGNDSIKLSCKPYFGKRDWTNGPHQLGVFCKNGDYEYYVDFAGELEVINSKQNKVLVKESGVWRMNP